MDFYAVTTQELIERISRHCPSALPVYLHCVNRADSEGKIFFTREMVEVNMSEGWTKFRNGVKKLALENVLEWSPFNNGISITLAAIDENE